MATKEYIEWAIYLITEVGLLFDFIFLNEKKRKTERGIRFYSIGNNVATVAILVFNIRVSNGGKQRPHNTTKGGFAMHSMV